MLCNFFLRYSADCVRICGVLFIILSPLDYASSRQGVFKLINSLPNNTLISQPPPLHTLHPHSHFPTDKLSPVVIKRSTGAFYFLFLLLSSYYSLTRFGHSVCKVRLTALSLAHSLTNSRLSS